MLNEIIENTEKYLNTKTKTERKKIGQFFTSPETANFMAKLSDCNESKIKILDAGAGTGILSIALLNKLENISNIKEIEIDLYENDAEVLPILEKNLNSAKNKCKKLTKYNIINKNFIIDNKENRQQEYDIIISNPPYKKIGKNDVEAQIMNEVVYGQPNIYFLFMAMSVKLLKENGEMIYIVPRSWTSGSYFKKFRHFFLSNMRLSNLHLFVSRDKVFDKETVLQETMILRAVKTQVTQEKITISQSFSNSDFNNITSFDIDYDLCVQEDVDKYVYLPLNNDDVNILKIVHNFDNKLEDIGLKLKTGLTVDFRNKEYLKKVPIGNNVPLLSSIHFKNGFINFPSSLDEVQYIKQENKALLQKNTNYLMMKRFSSKEEKRRIQPAIYLKKDFKNYDYISTENHINFISSTDNKEIKEELIYGLYGLYNSSLYDKYYRILDGSTQVNASEINNISIPNEIAIEKIGQKLRNEENITEELCDNLILEVIKSE